MKPRDPEDKRVLLITFGIFVATIPVLILVNMISGDSFVEALASPYMWMEITLLAVTLVYFNKRPRE